ncbi:maestro heat-like repeat family member 5 [Sminthopsis crassicaudata]|uniref:maestro heat-like repeat family member 5 n=1 Tax=Sminthopsis crassicaudata TaxID=9301 RepID=UPI003D680591
MTQPHRSSVSYLRHPSLQNFDTATDQEIESPLFRQTDLSTGSRTVSSLSHYWAHKVFSYYHDKPKKTVKGGSKNSGSITPKFRRNWTVFFRKTYQSRIEPERVNVGIFTEETRNAAICFKILKSLGVKKYHHAKTSIVNLCEMAQRHQGTVLTTIQQYFQDNEEQLEARHKFRILQVLVSIITSGPFLSEHWIQIFTSLALQHMFQVTELEEAYQNAASDLLVALWMHSTSYVMPKLVSMFWTGEFPHRSVLYAMGKIMSNDSTSVTTEYDDLESQLFQIGEMSAPALTKKSWKEELNHEINKYEGCYPGQSSEKTCLYMYYGVVLRASDNTKMVKEHLSTLLGTSHQRAFQREGMAITIGLVATQHLTVTCSVLEEFSKTIILEKAPISRIDQYLEDIHWKWASSTVLLCYGHIASRTKDSILTLADSITSRMVCYFQCSHWDGPIKNSFLTATKMLITAIKSHKEVSNFEFFQKPGLVLCLMNLIDKEPRDILCTSVRQEAMLAIASLSKLKPPLGLKEKSKILYICFRSVFTLPVMEKLKKHTCLIMNPPDIQVLFSQTMQALDQVLQGFLSENPDPGEVLYILEKVITWMDSERSHERLRAIRSITMFLKFIMEQFNLKVKLTRIGHLVGMLGMLCGDPDENIRQQAIEGMFHLYNILLHQKGLRSKAEANMKKRKIYHFGHSKRGCAPHSVNFLSSSAQIVKAFGDHFDLSELRDFMVTLIEGLHCSIFFRAQTAAEMLHKSCESYWNKLEEVTEIGKKTYLQLCLIQTVSAKRTALWAISPLVQHHTKELVFTFLEFSLSMNRNAVELWKAVGSDPQTCPKVLGLLLQKLEHRPSLDELTYLEGNYSESLAAMNTLYEIIFASEYQNALKTAFPHFFFAMVTQIHYIFELNLHDENCIYVNKDFTTFHTSPNCTSVEAVKSLFSKNGFWQEFAFLELQDVWTQLSTPRSFFQGVSMLSRAMVEYSCPYIPGILLYSVSMFQNNEERQRVVAMIFFTEFLRSPLTSRLLSKKMVLAYLQKGIRDSNLVVRVVSLHCFSNIIHTSEKNYLLRSQLPILLNAFYDPSEKAILASLYAVSSILYQLGKQSIGPFSLDLALSLRPFFDDERETVRGSAIYVFGSLVSNMAGRATPMLTDQVCRSLIPLLFHLMDQEEDVVMKAKFAFFRCANFLNWEEPEKLFRRIAWEEGLQALHSIWKCFMENMFSRVDLFLSQALGYIHSKQWTMRTAAALYIGHTINMLPYAVSKILDEQGLIFLFEVFAELEEDEEKFIRHVAESHFRSLQKIVRLV